MDPNESLGEDIDQGSLSWGRVAHILLVVLALAVAGIGLYECSGIGSAEQEFKELLNGKPLPLITQWVIQYRAGFVAAALFIPGAALATFALRERWQVISGLALLIGLGLLDSLIVHWALKLPLIVITKSMGMGSGR